MEEVCMEDPDSISRAEITDLKGSTNQRKENMLARLSQTDAHFKHQQRGEADLTSDEKKEIARNILEKNSSIFLARFGAYLLSEDLEYFGDKSGDYETEFYLQQLKKEKSKNYSANRVKNRRYQAMKQLIQEGEYFSDDSIKHRDPYLYEQLIGQYLTDEEIQGQVDKADLRFSTILLKHMDILEENQVFKLQKDKEDSQFEEEDEDSEDEEEMEKDEEEISTERKSEMREELYRIMQERFLSGQEHQFDYSQVDDNTAYDDLDLLDKDEEEKYFDSEEPEEISVPNITHLANSMLLDNRTNQMNGSEATDAAGQDTSIANACGSRTESMKTDIGDNSAEENVT